MRLQRRSHAAADVPGQGGRYVTAADVETAVDGVEEVGDGDDRQLDGVARLAD